MFSPELSCGTWLLECSVKTWSHPTDARRNTAAESTELTELLHFTQSDTGIYCARCRYNLTGLTVPRCPECGQPFKTVTEGTCNVTFEQVLLLINVFSLILLGFQLISLPPWGFPAVEADAAVVVAMLVPLQWVLALAALIAGLQSMNKCGRRWIALTGMTFPGLFALASLWALV